MKDSTDEIFMREAFKLALKGSGHVSPNPLVGALIVKNDIIIGSGFHEQYGFSHAEVNAINNCNESAIDSTVYCNLEPCCHYKKQTPPCAPMLIKNKVKKVVISNLDPNPEVSGNGVKLLRDAGIEVVTDVLSNEGRIVNEVFFHFIKTGLPYIHVKLAQTLDGKIATLSGDSKWISSESARKEVHALRLKYDAVMVGRNTVQKDNAKLNIRMGVESKGHVPYKIIVGKVSKLDLSLNIFNDGNEDKNIILTTIKDYRDSSDDTLDKHSQLGTQFIFIKGGRGPDSFRDAFRKLGELKISSILVEGGAQLITDLIKNKYVDKCSFYICPIILGKGLDYFLVDHAQSMKDAIRFENSTVRNLDGQAVMEFYPNYLENVEQSCLQV